MKKKVGTLYYQSPQIILRKYTNKCDLWAIGCILFILITKQFPFYNESTYFTEYNIVNKIWTKNINSIEQPQDIIELLNKLLSYEEENRLI